MPAAALRIGTLGARVGLSPDVLRVWERRYGLPRPARSATGQRLYDAQDEARVRRVLELVAQGYGTASAARQVLDEAAAPRPPDRAPEAYAIRLRAAIDALDDAAADDAIDGLLAAYSLDTAVGCAVLPVLAAVGAAWERGEITVAHEHFASSVIGGRMRALGRGWNQGAGPRAVLACPPGERHDLGLLAFGLLLRARGWRITFLGADAPADAIVHTADAMRPEIVVLAGARGRPLARAARSLAGLSAAHRVGIGGAAATPVRADAMGALLLEEDPVAAADGLTAAVRRGAR